MYLSLEIGSCPRFIFAPSNLRTEDVIPMPFQPTNPGTFVEENSSGVRAIPGVSTSVTAFVGFLKRGPLNRALPVSSFGEFDRIYGGLDADSEVSYAVQQFFLNGGKEALIVRVAADDPATGNDLAKVTMQDEAGNPVLEALAESPGEWGNRLQVDVDYDQVDPATSFNLKVTEFVPQGGIVVAASVTSFRNLSMDPASTGYAVRAVNALSKLIRLAVPPGVTHDDKTNPPAQTGTRSGLDISGVNKDNLNDTMTVLVVAGGDDLVSSNFNLNTGALQTVTYRLPSYRFDGLRTFTNKPPCGPKRGHGTPQPRFGWWIQDMKSRLTQLTCIELIVKLSISNY